MRYLVLSIIFGKFIILTPTAVFIDNEWFIINLHKPISAITNGAYIEIELPTNGDIVQSLDPTENLSEQLHDIFPYDSIKVELANKNEIIKLKYLRYAIYDFKLKKEKSISIIVSGDIPVKTKYNQVKIKSITPLSNVKVCWRNFGTK